MNTALEKPCGISDWLHMYVLYRKAFPASERKPFGIIRKMYRQGRTDVWCIRRSGKFCGFASTVNGNDLILLDYLAVLPECRGKGVGSASMALLREQYGNKGLFVEIESTLEDGPDQREREKRKQFYQNAGLEPLGVYARVFGVNMELLGAGCFLKFADYRYFYREHYSPWAAEHLEPLE